MGWETRQRGGRYYTRSRKVGGRVIREYVGAGLIGDLAAQTDDLMRERRRLDALAWRAERERLDAIERDLVNYCAAVGDLAREHLTAAGYHQHARGQWRRKRMPAKTKTTLPATAKPADESLEQVARRGDLAELQRAMGDLTNRAQHGDSKAMAKLRDGYKAVGDTEWEKEYTGPVESARDRLLEATLGQNLLVREAWGRRAKALQRDLVGANPTPLERILCERIATCWLDTQLADLQYAAKSAEGMSLAAGDYWQRRQDRAQRRYLDATLALARVRRLLAPIMQQVNIAQPGAQQLNIAQPASATPVAPAAPPVKVVTSPTWPPERQPRG